MATKVKNHKRKGKNVREHVRDVKPKHKMFSDKMRDKLANKKEAMPGGSFPIADVQDLKNAVQAAGRSKNPAATKAFIKKRAKELGATSMIPHQWSND